MSRQSSQRRSRGRRRKAAGALVVALLLVAAVAWFVTQRNGQATDAALTAAREHLARDEAARAIPLLRAVVQGEPKNGAARELLGQALLAGGDPAGALKELRRAVVLGRDTPDNRLGIARAHLLRGEFDEALARLAAARDESNPAWQLLSAEVRAARQANEEALPFYRAALERDPSLLAAWLGLARAEMALGQLEAAADTLGGAMAQKLDGIALWQVEGQLALAQRHYDAARAAFAKVLGARPQDELALLGSAAADIAAGAHDDAAATLDRLAEAVQAGPRAQFLRAMIAAARQDPEAALNHLRRVLAVAPDHRDSLRQAASLHFQLGQYGDAEHFLRRLAKLEPTDTQARQMLEAAQLASGRIDASVFDLDALDRAAGQDPNMLALLGSVLLRGGNVAAGEQALREALAGAPGSLAIERQLAVAQLAAGRFDDVLDRAPRLREAGDRTLAPDILVVAAHLGRRDIAAARETAEALLQRHAEDPYAHNVAAFVFEAAGDSAAARSEYERAVALSPTFDAATLNLARLDIGAKDIAAARGRYRALLERNPDHPEALDGLATLAYTQGKTAEALELWQHARRANPNALRPRLLLARHAREDGRLDDALDLVREASRVAPNAAGVQLEYCMTLLAADKHDEALPIAQGLARRFPGDARLARLLAVAVARSGDADALRKVLEDMVASAPDNLDARVALVRLALQQRRTDDARRQVEALLAQADDSAVTHELAGDLASQEARLEAAVAAYRRAFTKTPTRMLMLKLDAAERRAGRDEHRLAAWVKAHPDDLQAGTAYAARLQQEGEDLAASAEYERILARAPDSPVVCNNLAWLYRKLGDERALDMARKAYDLAPERAEVADTYGWILLERGRHEQALKILEHAFELAPGNRDIRFHRAAALERAGRTDDALRELEALLQDPADFESRAQAEQLRYELQG